MATDTSKFPQDPLRCCINYICIEVKRQLEHKESCWHLDEFYLLRKLHDQLLTDPNDFRGQPA
jgi:hypothetical protein